MQEFFFVYQGILTALLAVIIFDNALLIYKNYFYNQQNLTVSMYNKKQSQPNPTYSGNSNNRRNTQSSSRAVQNQSVNNQNKERLGSANRERNLTQDSKQSNNNWAKQKDEQLFNLVKEYLQKNGYNRSFQVLKNQRPIKKAINIPNHHVPNKGQQDKSAAAVQAFDKGDRDQFFKITNKIFQTSDQNIKKFQFECQIYFCIHAIHPSIKKSNTISQKAKDAFRKYIETKGAEITFNNQQFLSFYSLPFILKPQQQPSLSFVFTKEWLNKMRGKVLDEAAILNANNKSNQSTSYGNIGGRKVSALQQFFYNQTQNPLKEKEEECKENCKHMLETEQLKQINKELHQYIQTAQYHYKSFTEASKNNLVQSNVKWFQFSKQLLMMIKKAANGQKIQNFEKYQAFLGRSVEQLIYGTNDVSLFEKNSYFTEEVSINPTDNRNAQKRQVQQLVCQIDLNKVTNFLHEAPKPEKEVMVCLVLKALKDRFLQLKSPYARRQIIISYSRHDICGISEQNYKIQKTLLLQSSERVKQFYLRLLNYITTDFYGITYLSGSSKLIENIIGIFGTEHQFSVSRRYVLGILQRFSLLKKPQNQMISFGLIPIILKIFRNERQELSEYSIQYLTALIMNLSLRRSSKTHFEKNRGQVISILLPLLDTEDPMVKDYVNGALYSLIQASSLIKKEALSQQAIEKINSIIQETQEKIKYEQPENELQKADYSTLVKQYHYILDALTGENQIGDQSEISDSEEDDEQGDLDDIDEHDDDEKLSVQSDENEYIENQDQYLKGQELLLKQFALLGPQAIKEQILTRSVLDETSRKIHNMTASINRSRRIDNIFAQQRPGTPSLLPQLDKSIVPSRTRD